MTDETVDLSSETTKETHFPQGKLSEDTSKYKFENNANQELKSRMESYSKARDEEVSEFQQEFDLDLRSEENQLTSEEQTLFQETAINEMSSTDFKSKSMEVDYVRMIEQHQQGITKDQQYITYHQRKIEQYQRKIVQRQQEIAQLQLDRVADTNSQKEETEETKATVDAEKANTKTNDAQCDGHIQKLTKEFSGPTADPLERYIAELTKIEKAIVDADKKQDDQAYREASERLSLLFLSRSSVKRRNKFGIGLRRPNPETEGLFADPTTDAPAEGSGTIQTNGSRTVKKVDFDQLEKITADNSESNARPWADKTLDEIKNECQSLGLYKRSDLGQIRSCVHIEVFSNYLISTGLNDNTAWKQEQKDRQNSIGMLELYAKCSFGKGRVKCTKYNKQYKNEVYRARFALLLFFLEDDCTVAHLLD